MNKNVGKFSYQHPHPPTNWPPSYRTLVFHAHMLYIGNCILQSGMWITHIYIIFYRKIFNHDKNPQNRDCSYARNARKCEMRKKWTKNSNGVGECNFIKNSDFFHSLIALSNIYLDVHAVYGWVVDIKMQKCKMRAWIDDGDFFVVVFMHPCSCLPAVCAHFDWIILSKAYT